MTTTPELTQCETASPRELGSPTNPSGSPELDALKPLDEGGYDPAHDRVFRCLDNQEERHRPNGPIHEALLQVGACGDVQRSTDNANRYLSFTVHDLVTGDTFTPSPSVSSRWAQVLRSYKGGRVLAYISWAAGDLVPLPGLVLDPHSDQTALDVLPSIDCHSTLDHLIEPRLQGGTDGEVC